MQKFIYQIALVCLAGLGCAAMAQDTPEPQPAPAEQVITATTAEPKKTEEELKEELIASADHLSDRAKAALRFAAKDVSVHYLHLWLDGFHQFVDVVAVEVAHALNHVALVVVER